LGLMTVCCDFFFSDSPPCPLYIFLPRSIATLKIPGEPGRLFHKL
jgi:hypothetical protein